MRSDLPDRTRRVRWGLREHETRRTQLRKVRVALQTGRAMRWLWSLRTQLRGRPDRLRGGLHRPALGRAPLWCHRALRRSRSEMFRVRAVSRWTVPISVPQWPRALRGSLQGLARRLRKLRDVRRRVPTRAALQRHGSLRSHVSGRLHGVLGRLSRLVQRSHELRHV